MTRNEYNKLLDLQVLVQRLSADLPDEAMVDACDRANLSQANRMVEEIMDDAVRDGLTDG